MNKDYDKILSESEKMNNEIEKKLQVSHTEKRKKRIL